MTTPKNVSISSTTIKSPTIVTESSTANTSVITTDDDFCGIDIFYSIHNNLKGKQDNGVSGKNDKRASSHPTAPWSHHLLREESADYRGGVPELSELSRGTMMSSFVVFLTLAIVGFVSAQLLDQRQEFGQPPLLPVGAPNGFGASPFGMGGAGGPHFGGHRFFGGGFMRRFGGMPFDEQTRLKFRECMNVKFPDRRRKFQELRAKMQGMSHEERRQFFMQRRNSPDGMRFRAAFHECIQASRNL
ncbi:unnamed protein product [Caenorhabditis auriculariae]|uniref:Uncharacterized protein n=1 Tax=Caenorhabditis auriculariae TaxID=2777116 RepID=A0A8S1HVY7_9PELO|nr:unnamed protein product [Caenorhabditis auriculariae]